MAWLPIIGSLTGDVCPRCDRGKLYVRSTRRTGDPGQVQYLCCSNFPARFESA